MGDAYAYARLKNALQTQRPTEKPSGWWNDPGLGDSLARGVPQEARTTAAGWTCPVRLAVAEFLDGNLDWDPLESLGLARAESPFGAPGSDGNWMRSQQGAEAAPLPAPQGWEGLRQRSEIERGGVQPVEAQLQVGKMIHLPG